MPLKLAAQKQASSFPIRSIYCLISFFAFSRDKYIGAIQAQSDTSEPIEVEIKFPRRYRLR